MQVEPSWSIAVVLITALAAVYVWYLASQATIFDKVFAYPRENWGPLWGCPFCAGFWISGGLLLAAGVYDPITHLAVTGLTGLAGAHSG